MALARRIALTALAALPVASGCGCCRFPDNTRIQSTVVLQATEVGVPIELELEIFNREEVELRLRGVRGHVMMPRYVVPIDMTVDQPLPPSEPSTLTLQLVVTRDAIPRLLHATDVSGPRIPVRVVARAEVTVQTELGLESAELYLSETAFIDRNVLIAAANEIPPADGG